MLLLHGIAVLATVCSTVSAFSLRPPHQEFEDLSASRRSQRRATGFQTGGSPFRSRLRAHESVQQREYVRPRRTIQTTPKYHEDQDFFALESTIFNAPLPVSSGAGSRHRRHDNIPQAKIIQLNPTYRQHGIQQIPVRNTFDEPQQGVEFNPPTYKPQVSAAKENEYINKIEPVLHQKTEAPSMYRLTGVRAKGPRPTQSFAESEDARFAQPQGNGNIGNIRFIQEVPPTKLTFEESESDNDYYHPNHQYRDEAAVERKPHSAAFQSHRDAVNKPQSDVPQQHRTQIPEPAIEDFQAKQEEELLYYRQQQEQRRQKEEQLQGLLNQYEEKEPVKVNQKESVPYFEDESVEEERRVIPENPKVSQASKVVREERLPFRHERLPASDEQVSFSDEQSPDRQERNSARHESLPVKKHPNAAKQDSVPVRREPSPTRPEAISLRHQPNPPREESLPTRREPSPTRPEINSVRHQPNTAREESHPTRREPSPTGHEALPARHKQISASQERPIVTLKPVYPKNYKPEHQVKQPLALDRPDYESEHINFLPEYRQSFENNQPSRSYPNDFKDPSSASKEKRQAHHGDEGYIDHNGVEFAAAASAAEAAHGHGGDGRLTFQLHGQKGPHSYRFGFDTGKGPHRQFRYEERDNDGTVKGRYGYYDSHGKLQMYNYSAHPEHGYSAAEAH